MKIAVLGAGAWGTALAAAAAPRHQVLLWVRDPAQAIVLQRQRCNTRYLPNVALPAELQITADHGGALAFGTHGADSLTIVATPTAGLREQLRAVSQAHASAHKPVPESAHDAAHQPPTLSVLWLCKGFEAGSGALGHEVARDVAGGMPSDMAGNLARGAMHCGVLSGPSFAQEVARGQPTALVAASDNAALAALAVEAFHSDTLRVYTSSDVVGVEVGGAVKNVLAIATGILDGLPGAGMNARAALITRGLAEITRLGLALGARAETFMGLSGLGDLVLTATGDLSRNRRVGLLLAAGQPLDAVLRSLGHVAEGVLSAPTVLARAQALDVDMPITAAVVAVLQGRLTPAAAMTLLMAREARAEGF